MSNPREQLGQFVGKSPPAWTPAEGAIVCGEILRYENARSEYGDAPVCVIDDEERGPVVVPLSGTALLGQFRLLDPKAGETVGIKCLGEHPESPYWRFTVWVDRGQSETDFESAKAREIFRRAG